MEEKAGFDLLKEKVPEFRNPWLGFIIFFIWFLLFLLCMVFFWWFDNLVPCGALISQCVVALICSAFSYAHMKNARRYRQRYGQLAYRYFFLHFIMPIFATWFALIFHPLIVAGPALLPTWLAVILGLLLLSIRPLTTLHIQRSGFDNVGHGLGIYTVYPEEGTVVSSEIYSYIRHPMYLGSLCAAVAFGLFRNNAVAILVSLLLLVPIVIEVGLEDREMIERCGEGKREYIQRTGALFPKPGKAWTFLKLLLFLEGQDGQDSET